MSFSFESPDEGTRNFVQRIGLEARERLIEWTVPFYAMQFGDMKQCGTGVLLEIGDRQFILTAAHTFDELKAAELTLEIITDNSGGPRGTITRRSSATKDPIDRSDDPFDISVLELSPDMKEKLGGKRFLHLSDVDPWDKRDPRSCYMVLGFPTVENPSDNAARKVSGRAMAFTTFIYLDERGEVPCLDREVQYLLDFGSENTIDDAGKLGAPTAPHGMSGCGIWRLAGAGCSMDRWRFDDVKLVGIQHGRNKDLQVLRGTRIRYALQLIYRNHEKLQPIMDWHFDGQANKL
jgi:hypothetical protein